MLAGGAKGGGGHGSSFDLAIVDEIGLLQERDRELINSMRAALSAKDGKFIALSIWGNGLYTGDMWARRKDPGVVVHRFMANPNCQLNDVSEWLAANPGLGSIKSLDYMKHEAKRAASSPLDESHFRAQDLNLPGSPNVERNRLPFGLGSVWW